MNENTDQLAPRARSSGLVVRALGDEVLVYDLDRNEAHALNAVAAAIWRRCDGETTVAEVIQLLPEELGAPIAEDTIWHALAQLGNDHLLDEVASKPARKPGMTRRDMMLRTGALTAAVITSITVSTAAAHASIVVCGGACSGTASCPTNCANCQANSSSTCPSGNRCCQPQSNTGAPGGCPSNGVNCGCCSGQCNTGSGHCT